MLSCSLARAPACSLARQSKAAAAPLGSARLPGLLPSRRRASLRVAAEREDDSNLSSSSGGSGREPVGFKAPALTPAFTRRREHVVGRVAALGFGFSLVGELLTGIGPVTQLHYETGLSFKVLYAVLLGLAAFGLIGGLRPGSPTYDRRNLMDASKRGPPPNPLKEPRKFLSVNEVYIGRIAMAGFAGAVLLEWMWGGEAPLAHLGLISPGTPLAGAPWWTIILVGLCFATGLGVVGAAGDPGKDGESF